MKEQKGQIVFEAEITFKGGVNEFQRLGKALVELGVGVRPPRWPLGHEVCGCWPLPIWDLMGTRYMEKLVDGAQMFEVGEFIPKMICGGIKVAHVHMPSDEIALLDGRRFADLAERVGAEVVKKLGETPEYLEVTAAMRELAGKGKPTLE